MPPSELITEGISLMLFGMGFVFLFLTALVLMTSLMSKIIIRYCDPSACLASGQPVAPATGRKVEDGELIAAISAAIQMHRKHTRKDK